MYYVERAAAIVHLASENFEHLTSPGDHLRNAVDTLDDMEAAAANNLPIDDIGKALKLSERNVKRIAELADIPLSQLGNAEAKLR